MSDEMTYKPWPGRTFFLAFSALLALASIIAVMTAGLNFGVDFTGGSLLERRFERPVTVSEVRAALETDALADLQLASPVVQALDAPGDILIRVPVMEAEHIDRIDAVLTEAIGPAEVLRTELIGPVIGQELVRNAIWALIVAFVGMLIYLSFRFEFIYAAVAVIAIVLDALVVLGLVAVLQMELNTPFIAAILTVVGYGINDTIVIFDRIRENMRLRKRESVAAIVGASVRQSLTRSINTSVTTLFTVLAILFFGGASIRDFALVLAVGIVVGTYTSIFFASHLFTVWKERSEAGRGGRGGVRLAAKEA